MDAWQQRTDASIGTKAKQSVALYLRDPAASGGRRAVLEIYTDGEVTIYRGYLADSGLFGEEPAELNALIREMFPSAQWGEKRYYLTDHASEAATLARSQTRSTTASSRQTAKHPGLRQYARVVGAHQHSRASRVGQSPNAATKHIADRGAKCDREEGHSN